MRLFQRACREPLDGNTSFATMPTCFGRNTGQLHNELQFRARTTKKPDDELGSSLIGVGDINVAADGGTTLGYDLVADTGGDKISVVVTTIVTALDTSSGTVAMACATMATTYYDHAHEW